MHLVIINTPGWQKTCAIKERWKMQFKTNQWPSPLPLLHIGNVQKLEMDLSIKEWLIFGQMVIHAFIKIPFRSFKTQSPLKEVPAGGAGSQYLTRMLNKSISPCARRTYLQLPVSTLKYRLVPIKFWTPTSILRVLGPFSVNFKIVLNEFFRFWQIGGISYSFSSFSITFRSISVSTRGPWFESHH